MNDLYFECHAGISGDMTLGALVDVGADLDTIIGGLSGLPVSGFRLSAEKVKQKGVMGTRVRVEVDEAKDTHRTWGQVRDIVTAANLSPRVEQRALKAFERIAQAEATVHGVDVNKIHFHEVGCLDAIVDVVGAMLALEQLDVGAIHCSALNVGQGQVKCRHGVMPVPAPATVEIVKGIPIYQNDLGGELTTPTGAAIMAAVADGFGPIAGFTIENIGYGAGSRVHEDRPNYLRVCSGRLGKGVAETGWIHERLRLIETDMDDEIGETYSYLFERLFAGGALDVHLTAIQMKKNRPGHRLGVLTTADLLDDLIRIILDEASTLGVRVTEVDRYSLPRRFETIDLDGGTIQVKIAERDGRVVKAAPEYESCLAYARDRNLPLREVYRRVHAKLVEKFPVDMTAS